MPIRSPALLPLFCLLALPLLGTTAQAEEKSPSLYERRLGQIKGTAPGIKLWESGKPAQAAASAPKEALPQSAATQAQGTQPTTPTAAQAAAPAPAAAPLIPSGFLSGLSAPSGRSLNTARREGAVGGGIALPTARSASQPKADAGSKP